MRNRVISFFSCPSKSPTSLSIHTNSKSNHIITCFSSQRFSLSRSCVTNNSEHYFDASLSKSTKHVSPPFFLRRSLSTSSLIRQQIPPSSSYFLSSSNSSSSSSSSTTSLQTSVITSALPFDPTTTTTTTTTKTKNFSLKQTLLAYSALTKPRLSALVAATTVFGYLLAPGPFVVSQFLATTIGTSLAIASANTFNQVFEVETDARYVFSFV